MSVRAAYPMRVEADLEPDLSRWLWLVKWVLAIPHFVILAFLWLAYAVLTAAAFFAILFTGRYPRSIFEFNVGVLRWTWRVSDYAFGVLGTDRYPPFTIGDVPDYPARLEVEYPEHLSRGLVLVKWWLLAIPQYVVVGILVGGGWFVWREGWGAGLIGALVVVAAVVLLFTGAYPRSIFDLVLGLNRWVLRVAAYAGLMTDRYPPFRLDLGGTEPGGTLTVPRPTGQGPVPARPDTTPPPPPRWSGGRVAVVVIGALLVVASLAPLGVGGVAVWADRTQRDALGFVTLLPTHTVGTATYALASESVDLGANTDGSFYPRGVLDTVRIRVTPTDPTARVFVGIGPEADVTAYLSGFEHAVVRDVTGPVLALSGVGEPTTSPQSQRFWAAGSTGTGTRTLMWPVREGRWTLVVMNADGAAGMRVNVEGAARVPTLGGIGGVLLGMGACLLMLGTTMIVVAIRRVRRAGRVKGRE